MNFKGATALITGGGRGIGAATATALAKEGCRVAIVDRENKMTSQIESPVAGTLLKICFEEDEAIPAPDGEMDEAVIKAQLVEKLVEAVHSLTDEELDLIQKIFCLEKTEREIPCHICISI